MLEKNTESLKIDMIFTEKDLKKPFLLANPPNQNLRGCSETILASPYLPTSLQTKNSSILRQLKRCASLSLGFNGRESKTAKKSILTRKNEDDLKSSEVKVDTNLVKMIGSQHGKSLSGIQKDFIQINKIKSVKSMTNKKVEKKNQIMEKKCSRRRWRKKLSKKNQKKTIEAYKGVENSDEELAGENSFQDNIPTLMEQEKKSDESLDPPTVKTVKRNKCIYRFQDTAVDPASMDESSISCTNEEKFVRYREVHPRGQSIRKQYTNIKPTVNTRWTESVPSRKAFNASKNCFNDCENGMAGYGDTFDRLDNKCLKKSMCEKKDYHYPYEFFRGNTPPLQLPLPKLENQNCKLTSEKKMFLQKWQSESAFYSPILLKKVRTPKKQKVACFNNNLRKNKVEKSSQLEACNERQLRRQCEVSPVRGVIKPNTVRQTFRQPLIYSSYDAEDVHKYLNMASPSKFVKRKMPKDKSLPKIEECCSIEMNNNYSITTIKSIENMIPMHKKESISILNRIKRAISNEVNRQQMMPLVRTPRYDAKRLSYR